ncbi:hypothetical protein GCM10020254_81960 [Streptomyces goshikiensis]
MAHPAASLLTAADAESLDAAHAVEVYNALAEREHRGDSWHLTDILLNRGHRLNAYAADDAHFQPQDPPGCVAWVQVRAESLEPKLLLAALKAGHYYSSTGPELHDIRLDDGLITVRCSPVRKILITGGARVSRWSRARRSPRVPCPWRCSGTDTAASLWRTPPADVHGAIRSTWDVPPPPPRPSRES